MTNRALPVLLAFLLAAPVWAGSARTALVKAGGPIVTGPAPVTAADLTALRSAIALSGPALDGQAARVLAAALLQPGFIAGNQAKLEKLLGTPEAVPALQAKAEALALAAAQDPDLRAETQWLAAQVAARAGADLDAALASDGNSFDGTAAKIPAFEAEDPGLRRGFNQANFTPAGTARYKAMKDGLVARYGEPATRIQLSETPVILDKGLLDTMVRYGKEILQLLATPEYKAYSDQLVPPEYNIPGEPDRPTFSMVDFAVTRDAAGNLQPKVIEMQGAVSHYAYLAALSQAYIDAYGLTGMKYLLGGLDEAGYLDLLREAVLAGHDPKNVILMEIDPPAQKTMVDFVATEKLLGIKTVSVADIKRDGRKLYYLDETGARVDIKRIHNRMVPEEFRAKTEKGLLKTSFQYTDDLDVEWTAHPNWIFRMAKAALPWLHGRHESVTESGFLDRFAPANLEDYVLKPLYGWGGLAVNIHPTRADIDAIPAAERSQWMLMKRLDVEPFVATPFGPTRAEVRILYAWLGTGIQPLITFIRMGRSELMGVSANKGQPWAGLTAGLFQADRP